MMTIATAIGEMTLSSIGMKQAGAAGRLSTGFLLWVLFRMQLGSTLMVGRAASPRQRPIGGATSRGDASHGTQSLSSAMTGTGIAPSLRNAATDSDRII